MFLGMSCRTWSWVSKTWGSVGKVQRARDQDTVVLIKQIDKICQSGFEEIDLQKNWPLCCFGEQKMTTLSKNLLLRKGLHAVLERK